MRAKGCWSRQVEGERDRWKCRKIEPVVEQIIRVFMNEDQLEVGRSREKYERGWERRKRRKEKGKKKRKRKDKERVREGEKEE